MILFQRATESPGSPALPRRGSSHYDDGKIYWSNWASLKVKVALIQNQAGEMGTEQDGPRCTEIAVHRPE